MELVTSLCDSSISLGDTNISYVINFSQEDFLSPTLALPSRLFSLSLIRPLESVPSRISHRDFYLLHVTIPVVGVLSLTTIFIVICSVNNMWYDFINEILNIKQK